MAFSRLVTPIKDSLLVRTMSPRRGEISGKERVTSRQWKSSLSVPIVPPDSTTLRARRRVSACESQAVVRW